jgi:GntR family transcriptional repressor for pyruvate dehydrogenase complex
MTEPAASFRRVQVARAFEDIAGQIRVELTEGRLRAGDRLPPERELADRFGVSRNTLREALRSLEISGLIALKKGATGGAFVRDSNGDVVVNSLRDFYRLGAVTPEQVTEARIWIESAIVREAAARHTADDVAALHANLAAAQDAIRRRDFPARAETHLEFHRILARITRNPIVGVIMDGLIDVMRQFIRTIGPRWDSDYVLPSRRRFMRHLEARDAAAAVAEMERHLRRVRRNYLAHLGRPDGEAKQ